MLPDAVCRNCQNARQKRNGQLTCNRLRDVLHLWFAPDVPEEFWCKEWVRNEESAPVKLYERVSHKRELCRQKH